MQQWLVAHLLILSAPEALHLGHRQDLPTGTISGAYMQDADASNPSLQGVT
jgi:hypothetical protein